MKKEYKESTAYARCSALNCYAEYANKPECRVDTKHVNGSILDSILPSKEEYEAFLLELRIHNQMKLYWMVRFMREVGLRQAEVVQLKKACLKDGFAFVSYKGDERKVIISSKLKKDSFSYFEDIDSDYLFPRQDGEMMQAQSVGKMLRIDVEQYCGCESLKYPKTYYLLFLTELVKTHKIFKFFFHR